MVLRTPCRLTGRASNSQQLFMPGIFRLHGRWFYLDRMNVAMVTLDCEDPTTLAQWYVDAIGGSIAQDMEGFFVMADIAGMRLGFQKIDDELTPGKNRMHIDFHTDDDLEQTVNGI